MSLTGIILEKGYILLEPGSSIRSAAPANTNIGYGSVAAVYDTCDNYQEGQNLSYVADGQVEMYVSNVLYILIKEDKVITNEGFLS